MSRAQAPLRKDDWSTKRAERLAYWNRYLAGVPRPLDFSLRGVEDHGVSPEQVRQDYYKAWVFLAANVLPVMPETGYPYPQLCAGKPSLWGEGHPLARPSASWESFLAMQFYAYVAPAQAWQAYRGLMSLVDEEGLLGGESLPSRKAQTGMVLYQLTGDAQCLRETYPALRRYLLWRKCNPRWIHKGHDYADEKDADFAFSALVDMAYARDIARILEMPEEERFWEAQRRELFADCLKWFWESADSEPVEYYFTRTGRKSTGNPLWVSVGLHVDLLEGPHLDGLRRRFQRAFKPASPFCGFPVPKYPEISFSVYGLLERDLLEEAWVLANATVRDVVRAGMFAEQYTLESPPVPDGVRPSFFGVGALIDMLWIKNGYRMDRGWPHGVRLPGEKGGLTNLTLRGKSLDLRLDPGGQKMILSGDYVRDVFERAQILLDVPAGATIPIPRESHPMGPCSEELRCQG